MKVKHLLTVIHLFIWGALYTQENNHMAIVKNKTSLLESKTSGKFRFILPNELKEEDVNKNATYYIHHFTVSYNANSHEAEITMISEDDQSRKVILRFLTACGIKAIKLDDQIMDSYSFYEKHLK